MGKNQHSKDRMYVTATEWKTEGGGNKDRDLRTPFKRLPFYCCALTFVPFEDPVCTAEGHVFEIINIIPYLQKFHRNPVTGKPLEVKDLIKLQFHKNGEGEYQCPVLGKVFTEFTHIVAVKPTGHVYSYEAVRELNIKAKNWKDLLTDEPFTRADIITIQDPNNVAASKLLTEFDHVKQNRAVVDADAPPEDPTQGIRMSEDHKRVFQSLGTDEAKKAMAMGGGGSKAQSERAKALAALEAAKARKALDSDKKPEKQAPLSIVDAASASVAGRSASAAKAGTAEQTAARVALHAAGARVPVRANAKTVVSRFTTSKMSGSFTSTALTPSTKQEFAIEIVERNPKKKGYVRMQTNLGDLNIELHCDLAPRACENFITHCESGYYDNVIFHRNIKNFMIQGGDPTGSGKGGESIWGKPFKDEFTSQLTHSGRGVLSMANSGPHTNGSQFFILYKSAQHLNNKHTVFGQVVGGMETLAVMERIPGDEEDRPKKEIKMLSFKIFVNPYTEPDEEEEAERKKAEEKAEKEARRDEEETVGQWFSNPTGNSDLKPLRAGVGKYMKLPPASSRLAVSSNGGLEDGPPAKQRKVEKSGGGFGDFSSW